MGVHNLELINWQSFFSFRRINRFPNSRREHEKIQSSEDEKECTQVQACDGPSWLHNLLPFLEYLIILDPKLVSYEDRILGRPRQQYPRSPLAVPSSFEDLKKRVEDRATGCDCDVCDPWLYHPRSKTSHATVTCPRYARKGRGARFHHGNAIPIIQHPRLSLGMYGEYEAMKLVRHHVGWLDSTYLQVETTEDNVPALRLKSLLYIWNPHLASSDLRNTISQSQLLHLIKVLNQVFFFGTVPPHRALLSAGVSWLPESQKNCFGIGSFNPLLGTQILLHPTLYRGQNKFPANHPEDITLRCNNRLGTILHEMCHSFLKAYSCRACPSHDICMGASGHGRAWQILAAKIEQVATKVLEGFVDLGRYPSLLNEIATSGKLPSRHDLEVYQIGTTWDRTES